MFWLLLKAKLSLVLSFLYFITVPFEWHNPVGTYHLIHEAGYPMEAHTVITEDGYIIEVHRIPWGRNEQGPGNKTRPAILLQHGLMLDSSNFISNLPEQSFGYILADAGYDVWLGNSRGNSFGRRHTRMTSWASSFWDFTWEEMAQFDIPAVVNKMLEVTGHSSIYYSGHSQGALTMMAWLSENPQHMDKVREMYLLAPALALNSVRGPIKDSMVVTPFLNVINNWLGTFGVFRRNPYNDVLRLICMWEWTGDFCAARYYAQGGAPSTQVNNSRLEIYMASYPDGTSSKNFVHYSQMVYGERTAKFDYGLEENMKRYGRPMPPAYNFSRVQVPMHMFYSPDDFLTNAHDIHEIIIPSIDPRFLKSTTVLHGYNHLDFNWGLRAADDIYHPIIALMDEDSKGESAVMQEVLERYSKKEESVLPSIEDSDAALLSLAAISSP